MLSAFWHDFLQFLGSHKDTHRVVSDILRQTYPKKLTGTHLIIGCPKGSHIYLSTRISVMEKALQELHGKQYTVELAVEEPRKKPKQEEAPLLTFKPSDEDLFRRAGINPKYQFDNFAVSSSNQVAYAACQAIAESLGTVYNPLFLHGGVGVGKTHLAQAVARSVIEHDSEKRVFFCPGDQFINEIIDAIREHTTAKFRRKYRPLHLLIVDDVQFIAGKNAVQEEFFHTFNTIVSAGGQIILTSDRPPSEIKKLEDRLRSRFSGGLIADVQSPEFELRTAILLIKAQEKNMEIDMEAAKTIAEYIEDTRALEGTLVSIYAKIVGKKEMIDVEAVQDYFQQGQKRIAAKVEPNDVIKLVCTYYNIKQSHIKGPSRVEHIAQARQIAMYLLRTHLGLKQTEVAYELKRRDHTTVIHAVEKIEHLLLKDPRFKEEIDTIVKSLKTSP